MIWKTNKYLICANKYFTQKIRKWSKQDVGINYASYYQKCLHHLTATLERTDTLENAIFKFFISCYYTLPMVPLILSEVLFVELVLVSNP